MKTFYVAGHTFEDRVDAVCLKGHTDGTPCLIAWQSIRHCRTSEYEGKPDIAHIGSATHQEIKEIDAHAAREDEMRERAYAATMDLSKL